MRLTITKRNYWLLKTMMETYRSNATSRLGCPSTPFPDTHISPSIAYIQLVIFSLELLLDIWISPCLGRQRIYRSLMGKFFSKPTLELTPSLGYRPTLWTWMESTGWTLHWQKATYTFPIRIGSTDLSCPSRTAYSLVLLIGSGIGPIGALSGLKGFILLNSSGLRQRVKNRYSQHVVWLRLLLLSPL